MKIAMTQRFMTSCRPFKNNKKIKVRKLTLHSTGTPQPKISAYVNNQNKEDGRAAVHAFIGKDDDYKLKIVQTLPWDIRGWHCGRGSKGSYNDYGPGIEICEPTGFKYEKGKGATMIGYDPKKPSNIAYFEDTKNLAIGLFAYLCIQYNLDPLKDIVDHQTAHSMGYASNHGDIAHWWEKQHDYSLDDFRRDVKSRMDKEIEDKNTGTLYLVQLGAFTKKPNADAMQKALKTIGYDTIIVHENKYYKVQTGAFSIIANAERMVKTLKAKGFSAIIKTKI